ncbi:tetratricopeptide repeat protein [Micromonospora sp. NPDC049257]|uniref:tetratricopeptide repeat protein n=1 Tax=Micromonospora sp. NPDC049257 TaxID=3155771 RepID=UPI0034228D28
MRIQVAETLALQPLAQTASKRQEIFDVAYQRFASILGMAKAEDAPTAALNADDFNTVLSIHMAALAAADSSKHSRQTPQDPVGVTSYLLDREYDYWQASYENQRVATMPRAMARTVYTATLTRSMQTAQASAFVARLGIALTAEADLVVQDHLACYPAQRADVAFEPLYPDRLGEDFIALLAAREGEFDYPADPWAVTAPGRLLRPDEAMEDPPSWARHSVTVLTEVARRWPHVAHQQLIPLLLRAPHLAIAGGTPVIAALTEIPGIPLQVLDLVANALPGRDINIDAGAAVLARHLTALRLELGVDPQSRTELQAALAIRLSNAGLHGEALEILEEVVRAYRSLAEIAPCEFNPLLARELAHLGNTLAELGREDEGQASTAESLDIYRRLAEVDPQTFKPYVGWVSSLLSGYLRSEPSAALSLAEEATALLFQGDSSEKTWVESGFAGHALAAMATKGRRLRDVGRLEDAVKALELPARIYRQLPRIGLSIPEIVAIFTDLSGLLSRLGRTELALAASQDQVRAYRELARLDLKQFQSSLAMSLGTCGLRESELGHHDAAAALFQEAVDIFRQLVAENSGLYSPYLARAMRDLALCLSELGEHEVAADWLMQSAGLYGEIRASGRVEYDVELARSLDGSSAVLCRLERWEDALSWALQAVELLRAKASVEPDDLPKKLVVLTRCVMLLAKTERWEDAIECAAEATATYEELPAVERQAEWERFVVLHDILGVACGRTARVEEARGALEVAAEIYRRMITHSPKYRHSLATTLSNLGQALMTLGRSFEAESQMLKAVSILRELSATDPARHLPDLLFALMGLSEIRYNLDHHTSCLESMQEVVDVCRQLALLDAATYLPKLAVNLYNLSVLFADLGLVDDAIAPNLEAVQIGRLLARDSPRAHMRFLSSAVFNLGVRNVEAGRWPEALEPAMEAVEIRRLLFRLDQPAASDEGLAVALHNAAAILIRLGRHEDARRIIAEERAVSPSLES